MRRLDDHRFEVEPATLVVYRRGPAWQEGFVVGEQPAILAHGWFLAELERAGAAVHAGPTCELDGVAGSGPVGFASFSVDPDKVRDLLVDDPGLISGLMTCDIHPWNVAGL